ncbi:MAG: hypothetical protein AB7K08_01000 [Microbacteriaceae bacterium]
MVAAACAVVLAVTACSAPAPLAAETESAVDLHQQNVEALEQYVTAERATLPQIMQLYPGLYSEVEVKGTFEESNGDRGIPPGTYAVVWFDYTYANAMDWSATMADLDAQRSGIDDLCAHTIFPAMRRAGITGNLSVVYSYGDGRSAFGPMWSHTCSDY